MKPTEPVADRPIDNTPPDVPVPDYRPVERFWPYVDLPEQPTDEELAALNPELAEALFGTPKLPFSVSLEFSAFDGPDYERALEMARASAEYREIGQRANAPPPRALLSAGRASSCATCSRSSGRFDATDVLIDDRPVPYARELWLPLLWFSDPIDSVECPSSSEIQRDLQTLAAGPEAARGGIQHVLRGPRCRGRRGRRASRVEALDQALGPRAHRDGRRSLPVRDAPGAASRRSSISGIAACARAKRDGPGRSRSRRRKRAPKREQPDARRSCTSPRSRIRCARWTSCTRSTTR